MSKTSNLVGERFGKLTALERTNQQKGRYWLWRCRCECGSMITVSTKQLRRGAATHCGCEKRSRGAHGPVPEDLTGKRYGKLTVIRPDKQLPSGKMSWFCQCDCGNQCVVTADSLHFETRKSCGCLHRDAPAKQSENLTNKSFGRLTVLEPTEGRLWKCRCECGNEINVSEDSLLLGTYRSCGCVRQEQQENLHETMTYVENTCLEILDRRKNRTDNTTGFRGVFRGPGNKWLVTIGMQNKRYYIGLFSDFEDAVKARLRAEEILHEGFVDAYQTWQSRAKSDQTWAERNPFYFNVSKSGCDFHIATVFGSQTVSAV